LPSSDKGIFTEPLPSNDRGIFTEPLPSNDKGIHRHTHQRDYISLLSFFQNEESRLKTGLCALFSLRLCRYKITRF
jgi:hypothetical protein